MRIVVASQLRVVIVESARHSRETGRPPRSLVLLASAALVAGTGAALWALPPAPPGGWAATPGPETGPGSGPGSGHEPGHPPGFRPGGASGVRRSPSPGPSETLVAATVTSPTPPVSVSPPGLVPPYRGFLDAAGEPYPELLRAGVRSFTIGHVVAGPDGCTPRWAGVPAGGRDTVAERVERLRDDGGEPWPSFGGPYGPDPSVVCAGPARLLAVYRQVVTALDAPGVDIETTGPEVAQPGETGRGRHPGRRPGATSPAGGAGSAAETGSAGEAVARRRAAVLARLQREARGRWEANGASGSLRVTFTLPASREGLRPADRQALRVTREAGVEIESIGLLVPMGSGPAALHDLAVAARAARPQIAAALGVPPDAAWRRMGLAPVLADSADLGRAEAERLVAFRTRNGLAWLSVRGARPSERVLRILTNPASPDVTRSHPTPDGYPTP